MRQVSGKKKMERCVFYAAFLTSPFRGSGSSLIRWMPLYTSSGVYSVESPAFSFSDFTTSALVILTTALEKSALIVGTDYFH